MTYLQQLAFDRIETLSKLCSDSIPVSREMERLDCDEVKELLLEIKDLLGEQQDWISALNREEHS